MDYKKIFSPETIKKLDKKSNDNLKQMLGDKNLVQTLQSSQKLLAEIAKAEAPYKDKLEKLAVRMVKELYPIIDEEGIVLDAKLVGMSDVGKELDEIKVNQPGKWSILYKSNGEIDIEKLKKYLLTQYKNSNISGKIVDKEVVDLFIDSFDAWAYDQFGDPDDLGGNLDSDLEFIRGDFEDFLKHLGTLQESISPEGRRRIINGITQGSALRGAFSFYLFKEHLDEIDPTLIEKYNQIMKNTFGIYDDPNAVTMMLSLLAQGHKSAGGSSKVIIKEIKVNNPNITPEKTKEFIKKHNLLTNKNYMNLVDKMLHDEDEVGFDWSGEGENEEGPLDFIDELSKIKLQDFYNELQDIIKKPLNEAEQSNITIKARAICFPMLVHELIKGLYELVSLQGFKGDKAANQAVVNKVDKLEHEPHDLKYGKFVYDALNNVFAASNYNDSRIREFFFIDVYKLSDDEFISFIENAINESLTPEQLKWVKTTLKNIADDLKGDDFDKTGIDEIKINQPVSLHSFLRGDYNNLKEPKPGQLFKDWLLSNRSEIRYSDTRGEGVNVKISTSNSNFPTLDREKWMEYLKNKYPNDSIDKYRVAGFLRSHPEEIKFLKKIIELRNKIIYDKLEKSGVPERIKLTNLPHAVRFILNDKSKKFYMILQQEPNQIKEPDQINEYSEKTIQTTVERWKKENPKVDDNLAKQVIQRFDQIKNGLSQKLAIVSLSDELKKNNNYLNIDKYSFDDMVKLIRSLPENPDKIKKDAVNKFVDKETIDKNLAQSYVARFMAKKDSLKHGVENGLEDLDMKAEDVKKLIPKQLQMNNAYLDPRNWRWEPFEQMLDALFPSQKEHGEITNSVSTDADKVYNKDGIEIYKGDDVHKCISYNPANIKKGDTKYGWCITQPGNTNYDHYRFEERQPTFYFVFDRNKTSSPNQAPFKDKWHAFVVQVNGDGKSYVITAADNRGDERAKSWEDISKIVPADTWTKIKGLQSVFKPISLSPVERGRKFASGKNLSLAEFKELTQDEKIMYIQGKASKNQIGKDILAILPKYKIDYEGRSTTLANVAIDSGQKFSYEDLKDTESLAKRYAVFRFRHTDYSKDPLPLPFIKYLDEPGKEKYLKIFDENLNFDLIEKFFGEKAAETYVNNEVKNLQYVPPKAVKYIKDAKTKQLYSIYHKLTESWNFSDNFKLDEKSISKLTDMPVQDVTPVPINQEQWGKLSNEERKVIVDLAGKVNGNSKYSTLLYALPYIIKDGDKEYALLPKDNKDFTYDKWSLVDLNGKVVKDNISGDATLGDNTLITGYPSDNEKINRIYSMKDLKGEKLKEIKINDPNQGFTNEEIQSLSKLKKYFKDVKITYKKSIHSPELGLLQWISFTTKNGYNINFLKRTLEQRSEDFYGDYGFLLGGTQRFEGSLKQLVDYSIKNYKSTNLQENTNFNIPNPDYYQKLLNMSNGLSHSTAKYFQDVINSVKKQNGKATEKQWRILQRIKTGEFNLSTKN